MVKGDLNDELLHFILVCLFWVSQTLKKLIESIKKKTTLIDLSVGIDVSNESHKR
jgi:hypothetical protein